MTRSEDKNARHEEAAVVVAGVAVEAEAWDLTTIEETDAMLAGEEEGVV